MIITKTLFTHGVHFTKCALPWSRVHIKNIYIILLQLQITITITTKNHNTN
jgi:hypothetical protein